MSGPNRIDPTPLNISTNLTVDRQTPKADFGDRLKAGIDTTAGAVGNGAAIIAPMIPGAGIVSAAVSSVGNYTGGTSSGSSSVGHQYGMMAGVNLGAGASASPMGTTVGAGITPVSGGSSTGGSFTNIQTTGTGGTGGTGMDMVSQMASENGQMLKLQYSMQQESAMYNTISNVLKTRHDTAKNSIGNIR